MGKARRGMRFTPGRPHPEGETRGPLWGKETDWFTLVYQCGEEARKKYRMLKRSAGENGLGEETSVY